MRIIIIFTGLIILYTYYSKNNIETIKEGEIPKYIKVDENLPDVMEKDTIVLGKRPLCLKK